MKQLSSFMVLNIDGGDRVSYTFNEIDDETGEPLSQNNKGSFWIVNEELKNHVNELRNYIKNNKLS